MGRGEGHLATPAMPWRRMICDRSCSDDTWVARRLPVGRSRRASAQESAGRSAAWQRACFGSRRSPVRIRPPRPRLTGIAGRHAQQLEADDRGRSRFAPGCRASPVGRGRVAILVHALVPGDARIRRQGDALVDAGYEVDVFALRGPGEAAEERDGPRRIIRLPVNRCVHRLRRPPRGVRRFHRDRRSAPGGGASVTALRPRPDRHRAGLPRLRRAAGEVERRAGPAGPPRGHAGVLPGPIRLAAPPAAPPAGHRRQPRVGGRCRRADHRPRAAAGAVDRAGRGAGADRGRDEWRRRHDLRPGAPSAPRLHGRRDAADHPPQQPPADLRPRPRDGGDRRAARRDPAPPRRLRRRPVAAGRSSAPSSSGAWRTS